MPVPGDRAARRCGAVLADVADDVDRGLISAQCLLQRGLHRLIEPVGFQPPGEPLVRAGDKPAETGGPSSAAISIAVRSTGTLPSLPSRMAAALTFAPQATVSARPSGGSAQVTFRSDRSAASAAARSPSPAAPAG